MSTTQETPTALDRRTFCACALAAGAVACGGGGGGGDSTSGGGGGGGTSCPTSNPGAKTTTDTKAALLASADGTVRDYRSLAAFWLVKDSAGIYAMTSICTHQGCCVNVGGSAFACPCHGSQYDLNGGNTQGPATIPLNHYAVSEPSPGAALVVDTSQTVASSVRLT